jgi:serine/threonine protein kinase
MIAVRNPVYQEETVSVPQPPLVAPLRQWDPEQVGGYVILGRLGAGGMGQVYLGRSAAGRLVAVKTIKSELAEEPDFRTRFGQEVAAARRVSGAFTAAVIAADSEADVPWLATVYVPAPSLSRLIQTCGPLPVAAVRWLAAGCAEALEAIHSVGLVHRDLKPSNVLVSPDGPRVIDFGVARAAERIQLTVSNGGPGTPAYMAPEQARDPRQATAASDVFSLGGTILFAATGHAAYQGETVMDVLLRLATEPPDLTGLPWGLAGLVAACLERDPRSRPTTTAIIAQLSGTASLESPSLPASAVALIEAFRAAPAPGAAAPVLLPAASADPPEELTFGSQPSVSDLFRDDADFRAPAKAARTGPRWPAPSGRVSWASRTTWIQRRTAMVVIGALAGAAVIGGGFALGSRLVDPSHPPPSPTASPGPRSVPPSRPRPGHTSAPAPGTQSIEITPQMGQPTTTFTVKGQNWPPRTRLTLRLLKRPAAGSRAGKPDPVAVAYPLTSKQGAFSYRIKGQLFSFRTGPYGVLVTDPGNLSERAMAPFWIRASAGG